VQAPNSLERLLAPASVALVGASDNPDRIGGRALAFLRARYQGRLNVVSPSRESVQGVHAVRSVSELPETPDLVIIALGPAETVATARECAALRVGALVVFGAGFAEAGPAGEVLQSELAQIASESGLRILGPNCLGYLNVAGNVPATFFEGGGDVYPNGGVALVSQSGAFGAALFKSAHRQGLAISMFCSTGNEVDVTVEELLEYLV
jgi:acetate---CoA ligase (ADP-forming)